MTFVKATFKNSKSKSTNKTNKIKSSKMQGKLKEFDEKLKKYKVDGQFLDKIKISFLNIIKSFEELSIPKKSYKNNKLITKTGKIPDKIIYPTINFQQISTENNPINNKTTTKKSIQKRKCTKGSLCEFHKYLRPLQLFARKAHKLGKVFTVYGQYPIIRKCLRSRGWIEKFASYNSSMQGMSANRLMMNARPGNNYEAVLLSKLLTNCIPNFIWQSKKFLRSKMEIKLDSHPLRNRILRGRKYDFTTKIGLLECVNKSHWNIEDSNEILAPRCFYMDTKSDLQDFQNDYGITSCLNLLLFISKYQNKPEQIFSTSGLISIDVIIASIKRVRLNIFTRNQIDKNKEIDLNTYCNIDDNLWTTFHFDCEAIINGAMKFMVQNILTGKYLINECIRSIDKAKNFYPLLESEGFHNIWIIKPGSLSRGRGILIKKNYLDIINVIKQNPKSKYIVQKYIERPLLIYKTKFDIRQYFLMVINKSKFEIWMYKECYLKFSSKEFDLKNLEESVHLTNHSVQKKYKNAERNKNLPENNMWNLNCFKNYLNSIDKHNIWNGIYNGMKKNIIPIVLCSIEDTFYSPNSFELFGCDFILDENFNPLLIEINATPDMSPSTAVTANLCPKVLEDIIKVVIDLKTNPETSTGNFERIYENEINRNLNNRCLIVQGKKKPIESVSIDGVGNCKQNCKIQDESNTIQNRLVKINDEDNREMDENGSIPILHDHKLNTDLVQKNENEIERNFNWFLRKLVDNIGTDKEDYQKEIVSYLVNFIEYKNKLVGDTCI